MSIPCKANEVLELLTGKWKHIILFHMMEHETLRFSELQRLIPTITKKMLSTHLREFEHHQIINRTIFPSVPPKVEYTLTDYGKELKPIMETLHKWGDQHAKQFESESTDSV
ncbi:MULTISPECIES: winged helix-turn-helix transcriptional regulator [Pontibacillus]|uniref:Winged helix-turn-helix transcriptional regulator n=1 Tax=Pontibacillus chungwhensis TaxID=265426 RepID=A0ABY8UYF2_9BACI|nr:MULTISPECIES: winged helix-turn-helix transcriptional regulator [Pontibacillus]MCD5323305.1 winged helix-turn-helix transcriptional regulator [Pontibacillus sp. HN14]WIF96686.1 winged helix-turn-helix transcriptional regulator [Pontibacillus chungwhensis]